MQQIRILLYLVEQRHVQLVELGVPVKQQVLSVHRVHLGKNLLDKLYQQNQPMPLVVQEIHVRYQAKLVGSIMDILLTCVAVQEVGCQEHVCQCQKEVNAFSAKLVYSHHLQMRQRVKGKKSFLYLRVN